jgi:SAM-dependent methyltransferase
MRGIDRTPGQAREHYLIERELADRLRRSTREERRFLYRELYDELFRRVPYHPELQGREGGPKMGEVRDRVRLLRRFTYDGGVCAEVGAGDGAVARELARYMEKVYAFEVSEEPSERTSGELKNLERRIYDGLELPLAPASVDLVYSDQVIEHLHPDDVVLHFETIHRALKVSGVYVFGTPHCFSGPHDISKGFDLVATGFHLREWTNRELVKVIRDAGFRKVFFPRYPRDRDLILRIPVSCVLILEGILQGLKADWRRPLANTRLASVALGILIAAVK